MSDIRTLDPNLANPDSDNLDLLWYDIRELGVDGRAFDDTESYYDRLPVRAQGVVPDMVWELSKRSAGICVRFETDAKEIHGRWTLRYPEMALDHMPALGVSGLDLYGWHDDRWHFAGVGRADQFPTCSRKMVEDMNGDTRRYLLYLPLYNGVEKVELGLPRGATICTAGEPNDVGCKPILFYGTSIVQGGCASRPGMAYPAIVGRRLNRRTINLGFSGNGRAEVEVARFIAEIDASVYVVDPIPNLQPEQVTQRIEPFVKTLREARPTTPIVLVENITYQTAVFCQSRYDRYTQGNANMRAAHERLLASGVTGLHYVAGDNLLGHDGEATVDSTHPTDVGFMRMADVFEPVLRPLV